MHPIASQNYSFGSLKSPCANDPNFLALTASPIYQQEPLIYTTEQARKGEKKHRCFAVWRGEV